LDFLPWDEEKTFTVLVNDNWDSLLGSTFRVEMGYSGTNMDSYALGASDYVKFTVVA
jgi:hypothetical protein